MTTDLKPYPAYKDSGVSWLGEIPTHWRVERAKWLFRKMNRPVLDSDDVVTCFRDGVVTLRKNRRVRGFTESLKEIGYQGIRRGDLVIHAMDAFAGAIGVSDSDGKGSPVYSVCQPNKEVDSHYYAYAVREMARRQWILALATGIRERSTDFRFAAFASQQVPLPRPDEQHAIVRYLDYMDRRIRRYIRAKQKLIALLEEQKQAIIHQAVTRGLAPNVRLKPSGVEWLGDVPEHWSEVTVGQIAESLQTGPFGSQLHASDYVEGGIPVINPLHLRGGKICADSKFAVSQDTVARLSRHKLELDDVVIGRRGEMGRCGLVGAEEVGWLCGTGSMRLRPKPGFFDPKYLLLLLTSKRVGEFLSLVSVGATMENLNPSIVSRVRLPCPPVAEQQRIIALVNDLTSHVEHAIKRAEREIALLREYRTRLIADVVTGQVDVRAAAAQLPDETELDQIVNEEEAQNNGEEELELAEEGEEIYE